VWTNFFLSAAGASAALAGLVLVAISVNISRLLQFSHLPARAGATIGRLILVFVSRNRRLIPF
jgi:presenilin-like A22 family membrane protease